MSASGSQALVSALEILVVLVLSGLGTWWLIRRERREPSSYSRRPDVLADWRDKPAVSQESWDEVVLDATEAQERAAMRDVDVEAEMASVDRLLEEAARRNALFHP